MITKPLHRSFQEFKQIPLERRLKDLRNALNRTPIFGSQLTAAQFN